MRKYKVSLYVLLFFIFIVSVKSVLAVDHIVINEIYPNANTGELEWLELYNPTGSDINLSDWSLCDNTCDENDKGFSLTDEYIVLKNNYLVLEKGNNFPFGLNNSGDIVILRDKERNIIDSVVYGSFDDGDNLDNAPLPRKGESISRIPNGADSNNDSVDFQIVPFTKNAENKMPENAVVEGSETEEELEVENEIISVRQARESIDGTNVVTEGIVTTVPGDLSDSYFYLQDESAGIQIYCYKKDFPLLEQGYMIRVTGELSSTNNERRIKIVNSSEIVIIENSIPLQPLIKEIDQITEDVEGTLVGITGQIIETFGSQFTVIDKKGTELKILIRKPENVNKPKLKKGDQVEISGIVSQYKDYYRILPFLSGSVKIIKLNSAIEQTYEQSLPVAGQSLFFPLSLSLTLHLLWKAFYLKMKRTLFESHKRLPVVLQKGMFLRLLVILVVEKPHLLKA